LCKVGIVVWSAGGECEEGRGSLVTGWGRMGREGVGGGQWMRRGRKSSWEGEQRILAQEEGQ
jgi:hypothetical protein